MDHIVFAGTDILAKIELLSILYPEMDGLELVLGSS